MPVPPIEALTQRHGLALVGTDNIDRFLDQADQAGQCGLLFFPGHAKPRPEANDVAVILPQILDAFGGRLAGAVVDGEAEDPLAPRFGALVFPSLVVMRGGRVLGVIPRVKDWRVYLEDITRMLSVELEAVP